MKYQLRDYQQEASDAAVCFFRTQNDRNGLLILPTGAGKSLVIADIAFRLGEPLLVLQPSREILTQNYGKLKSYGVEDCSIYSASLNSKEISRITFATIGSIMAHIDDFDHFEYIIVDEAHNVNASQGQYKNFFAKVKRKILGLTATPYRLNSALQYLDKDENVVYRPKEPPVNTALEELVKKVEERQRIIENPNLFFDSRIPDPVLMTQELEDYIDRKKEYIAKSTEFNSNIVSGVIESKNVCILKFLTRTRPRIFHDVVYQVDISTLLERGYLARVEYFDLSIVDQSKLKRNSTGMDFDDRSLSSEFKRIDFEKYILDVVIRLLHPKRGGVRRGILVFTKYIEECEALQKHLPSCAVVTGSTPKKNRDEILENFKLGSIDVLVNVGVLTTGFDYPELDTVVMARPTMSLALYYQIIGRGIRPHPSKSSTWFVDLCGNIKRFGKVEDLHLTELNPGEYIITGNTDGGVRQLTNVYF